MAETLLAHVEHLLPGRTEDDVLSELLLKLGLDLCVPTQARTVAGKQLRSIAGGVLIACLDPQIQAGDVEPVAQGIIAWHKELAPAGDTTCVFRDSAFADDVAKTNMAAILEQNGIANVRSL
jgi:adenine-specific DNA-methyltransferase